MPSYDNPFTPSGGAKPRVLVGPARQEIERFANRLRAFETAYRGTLLMGVRGTGKSTVLNEFRDTAMELDWVVGRQSLRPGLNNEADIANTFNKKARRAVDELSGLERAKRALKDIRESVTIEIPTGDGGKFAFRLAGADDAGTLEDAMSGAIHRIGEVAQRRGRGVVFMYDEIQYIFDRPDDDQFPLSALLGAFTSVAEAQLPVALVLAGLPSALRLMSSAQQNAARSFEAVELGQLSTVGECGLSPAAEAVVEIAVRGGVDEGGGRRDFEIEEETAEQLARDSGGYLAGIQALGAALVDRAFEQGTTRLSHELYERYRDELLARRDRELYLGEWQRIETRWRPFVYAATDVEEPFSLDQLRVDAEDPRVLLDGLEQAYVIHEQEPDRYAFTYGGFVDFVRRQRETP